MLNASRLPDAALTADEWASSHRHLSFAVYDCEVHYLTAMALASSDELFAHMLLKKLKLAKKLGNDGPEVPLVRVNSHVDFVDGQGGQRSAKLVHAPEPFDGAEAIGISSLTAAGLIGLSVGQAILWPSAAGEFRPLEVVRVARAEPARLANQA